MLLWLPYQLEARCDDLSQGPDPPDRPRKRRGAEAIAGDVLRPAVVTAVIDGFLEQLLPANVENRVDELRRARRKLDGKIANLTAAIEQGRASLPSIIGLLSERRKERDVLVAEIGSAETLHQIHVDRPAIEAKVQRAVGNWRGSLSGSVADGRQLLREVLEAPLRFTRVGKTYRFTAPVATGQLIAGAVLPIKVASPSILSWNQILTFLQQMAKLRESAGLAA